MNKLRRRLCWATCDEACEKVPLRWSAVLWRFVFYGWREGRRSWRERSRVASAVLLLLLVGCGSTSKAGGVGGAPGFSAMHVDADGALTAHTLAPTWPTSATVDENGLDLLSGQPTSNMGFTLPDGAFVGIQSTSDVTGTDWTVTVGDVSISLGEIGIDRGTPIAALAAQIEPLVDAIVQALVTTGEIAATQADAASAIVRSVVEGIVSGATPIP